jgi:hypothetical protein
MSIASFEDPGGSFVRRHEAKRTVASGEVALTAATTRP